MEAYSVVGSFNYKPLSLKTFNAKYPNGANFCVFLDEFTANDETVIMARNLARHIGAPCLVANTNINITNLVGVQSTSRGPEQGQLNVHDWSVDFHRFGLFNRKIADETLGLSQPVATLIGLLKAKCSNANNQAIIANCFDELFGACLDATRPGIAENVLKQNERLVLQVPGAMTFYQVLEAIFTAVKDEIVYQKPGISKDSAQLAKLGL